MPSNAALQPPAVVVLCQAHEPPLPAPAGISSFPAALGRLAALEALQLEGCPLERPLAQIYARNPLLLVPLHAASTTSLDLPHIGLDTVGGRGELTGC